MSEEHFIVRPMEAADIAGVAALQRACFPPPFPEELLWKREHLKRHLEVFPVGQLVALSPELKVVGSGSSCVISEENWRAHRSWDDTVGGPYIRNHDGGGSTLYGLDISVHPRWRGQGVGRAIYDCRYHLVRALGLARYGTACRLPGYAVWSSHNDGKGVEAYCQEVLKGVATDRTLTPLLRYGLSFKGVIHDYMNDQESGNAAAILEWSP